MAAAKLNADKTANQNGSGDNNKAEMSGKSGVAIGNAGKSANDLSKKTKRADFEGN